MSGYAISVLEGIDDITFGELGYSASDFWKDVATGGAYSATKYASKKFGGTVGTVLGLVLTGMPVKQLSDFVDDPSWKSATNAVYGFMGGLPDAIMPQKYKKYCAGMSLGTVYSYYTGDLPGGLVLALNASNGFKNMEKGDWKGIGKTFLGAVAMVGSNTSVLKQFGALGKNGKGFMGQLKGDKGNIVKGVGAAAVGLVLKALGLSDSQVKSTGAKVPTSQQLATETPMSNADKAAAGLPVDEGWPTWAIATAAVGGVAVVGGGAYFLLRLRKSKRSTR